MPKTSKRISQAEVDWMVQRLERHNALDGAQPVSRGTFRKVLWGYKTTFPERTRTTKALHQTLNRIRKPNKPSISTLLAPMIRSARRRLQNGPLATPKQQQKTRPVPSPSGNGHVAQVDLIAALQQHVADLTRRVGDLEKRLQGSGV